MTMYRYVCFPHYGNHYPSLPYLFATPERKYAQTSRNVLPSAEEEDRASLSWETDVEELHLASIDYGEDSHCFELGSPNCGVDGWSSCSC